MQHMALNDENGSAFSPDADVSYSAGVAYILVRDGVPHLLLVLQRGGERNTQSEGSVFVELRSWKMPMGHFDPEKDADFIDTAAREFQEESGYAIRREDIRPELCYRKRIISRRPGAKFHEDVFFLVLSDKMPPLGGEKDDIIEKADFFALNRLPSGVEEKSLGAEMSTGHRKKLEGILEAYTDSIRAALEKN